MKTWREVIKIFGFNIVGRLVNAICSDAVADPGEQCDPPNGTT